MRKDTDIRTLIIEYGEACMRMQPDIATTLYQEIDETLVEAYECAKDLNNNDRDYSAFLGLARSST